MNAPNRILICLCAAALLAGCGKGGTDKDELSSRTVPVQQPLPPLAPKKFPEPPRYAYPFDSRRDPFTPLVGGASYAGSDKDAQMIAQSFSGLELKGILKDKSGKIAMIAATSGESYMLKSGRIYDKRNHIIHGVTGIIKENSVVLIGRNKTVKELILARKDGASGNP